MVGKCLSCLVIPAVKTKSIAVSSFSDIVGGFNWKDDCRLHKTHLT